MLIRKRFRVWKTAGKSMLYFAAGVIVIALFIRFDITGYERRVPNPDDVVAVSFSATQPRALNILFVPEWQPDGTYPSVGNGWSVWTSYCCAKCNEGRELHVWSQEIIDEIKQRSFDFFESPEAISVAVELHQAIVSNKRDLEGNEANASNARFYLMYLMKSGQVITREYVIPIDESVPPDVAEKMLALYSQQEAVAKRNRFMTLPEAAIIWAGAVEYDDYGSAMSMWQYRSPRGKSSTIPEDVITEVIEAMRRDVAAGSLGYVDVFGDHRLYYNLSNTLSENRTTVVIQIMYDRDEAGVPAAFDKSFRVCPEIEEHIEGFLQTITINVNNVHTMQTLKALGIFDD